MAVWRQNIVLVLAGITIFSVGNGMVIETTTVGKMTTTLTPSITETTLPAVSRTTSASFENITSILMNLTTSENATMRMNGTTETLETAIVLTNETRNENITSSLNRTNESPNITISDTGRKILDLAFIMDTTGSMGAYIDSARNNIRNLVDEINVNSDTDLRMALIEYRDHPPQEKSFVTRTNDFTKSVRTMKKWLKKAEARGGGDGPEAVAEGLFNVKKLSWRPEAAKITVLISDAPPHGLAPWEDRSFKEGSPNGNDPIQIAQDLAKREITVYAVGCEPSINPYKDFFMALAYITGGQYIPLSDPLGLIQAIIGGAQEELSLQKFSKDVEEEISRITASGAVVDEASIAKSVYEKLRLQGAKSQQLLRNNETLEGASTLAKTFAASFSMADVRKAYASEHSAPSFLDRPSISTSFRRSKGASMSDGKMDALPPVKEVYAAEYMPASLPSSFGAFTEGVLSSSGTTDTGTGESYSTVDSAVSYEQIARLVRKKTAKLSTP